MNAAQRLVALEPYTRHKAKCDVDRCATCGHFDGHHATPRVYGKPGPCYCGCQPFTAGKCTCGLDALLHEGLIR